MLDRILGLSAMLSLSWAAAHAEDCGHLARLKLDHVVITSAEAVPAGAPTAGWNDPAIPPGYSLEYRERLAAKTGGVKDFYRLYMVPGMLHCGGGDAPTTVNWQAALEAWVEKAVAPADLVAIDGKGATQTLQRFE